MWYGLALYEVNNALQIICVASAFINRYTSKERTLK